MQEALNFVRKQPLTILAFAGLISGFGFWATDNPQLLAGTAFVVLAVVIAATAVDMVRDLLAGHWGLDVLAIIAMGATLAVAEYLAGLIIAVMLTGGEALEAWAERRATRELDSLLTRAPAFAQRLNETGDKTVQIAVGEVEVGDVLLVRTAEVIPVDGVLLSQRAVIDEASVTGESVPVAFSAGDAVLSGTVNTTEPFKMRATKAAADSQYASIVRLVESAIGSRAPMVRLADRYAVPFTIVSLLIAGIAWYVSGDPVRFAEVLVVATPCPLLIAAPVAFMGGMSSAAEVKVIIKDAGTLETLARVRTAAFDKTGTLTVGRPEVVEVRPIAREESEVLAIAAALEQYSLHVYAQSIINKALENELVLPPVTEAEESQTNGVEALLANGSRVRLGKPAYVEELTGPFERTALSGGQSAVYLAVDSVLAGVVIVSDPIRDGSRLMIERLRTKGVERFAMISGDVAPTAEAVAQQIGIDTVHAETRPEDKMSLVSQLTPRPVLMVGDGINDAPVLAAADVGIAMADKGATVASEAASAVLVSPNISRIADVTAVAQRTVSVAIQSIWAGIIVSVGLMLVAAFGYLPAVVGALLQEVVDLVAIFSALRALTAHRWIQKHQSSSASAQIR